MKIFVLEERDCVISSRISFEISSIYTSSKSALADAISSLACSIADLAFFCALSASSRDCTKSLAEFNTFRARELDGQIWNKTKIIVRHRRKNGFQFPRDIFLP